MDHIDEISRKHIVDFKMESGDMLLVDNYRVLHGRDIFEGDRLHAVSWFRKVCVCVCVCVTALSLFVCVCVCASAECRSPSVSRLANLHEKGDMMRENGSSV